MFSAEHFDQKPAYTDADRIAAARGANWVAETHQTEENLFLLPSARPAPPVMAPAAVAAPPPASASASAPVPVDPIEVEPVVEASPADVVADSPLFSSLAEDELVAVIKGLRLLSYQPGDIILTQGDPGSSMFVITEGALKAFVRSPDTGKQVLVRTMAEGEFFGEISILSGKPRTATVTAALACELLELDRGDLDHICSTHPRVREVLEDFYIQRATSQGEAMARDRASGA
jgi:hypothetical protein